MRAALIIIGVLLTACADPQPTRQLIEERVSGTYQPTDRDRAGLYARMAAYWSAIAARDFQQAYDFHTFDFRERVPFSTWSRQQAARAGLRRAVKIHWTKGVHRYHGPELYAIVDWTTGAAGPGGTGKIVWRQEDDGTFWVEN